MDEGLQILASLTSRGRFGKIFMFPFIWKCWEQKLGDTAVELTLRTDVCSSNPAFFSGSVISGVGRVKSSGTK